MAAAEGMSYDIVSGPSREELFDALLLRNEMGPLKPRCAGFTLVGPTNGTIRGELGVNLAVNGIIDLETAEPEYYLHLDGPEQLGRLYGTYNARLRRGQLRRRARAEERLCAVMKVVDRIQQISRNMEVRIPSSQAEAADQINEWCHRAEEIREIVSDTALEELLRQVQIN